MADSIDSALVIEILTKYLGSEQAKAAAADLEAVSAKATAASAATTEAVAQGAQADAASSAATAKRIAEGNRMADAYWAEAEAVAAASTSGKEFVVSSEAVYRSLVQQAEALTLTIARYKVQGVSTVEEEKKLQNISNALSTESALRVSQRMEAEKSAAAEKKLAEAQSAEEAALASKLSTAKAAVSNANLQISRDAALANGNMQLVATLEREMAIRKEMRTFISAGMNEEFARNAATRILDAEAAAKNAKAIMAEADAQIADTVSTEANTAAKIENNAATDASILGVRKGISLLDEVARGQRGAMVGTIGSLFKSGGLMEAVINPVTILAAAADLPLFLIGRHLKNIQEEMNKTLTTTDQFNDDMKRIVESVDSSDVAFVKVTESIARARAESSGLSAELKHNSEMAQLFAQSAEDAADRLSEAHTQAATLKEKMVDLLVASGKVTAPVASLEKARIEHEAKLAQMADERNKVETAIAQKESQLKEESQTMAKYPSTESAAAQKESADQAAQRNEAIIKGHDKAAKDIEKQINDAKHAWLNLSSFADKETVDAAWGRVRDAERRKEEFDKTYQAALKERQSIENAAAAADATFEAATKNKQTIDELNLQLAELKNKLSDLNAKQFGSAEGPGEIGMEQIRFELESLKTIFSQFKTGNVQQIYQTGGVQGLEELLQATGFNKGQMENIVRGLHDHTIALGTVMNEVNRRIAELQRTVANFSLGSGQ